MIASSSVLLSGTAGMSTAHGLIPPHPGPMAAIVTVLAVASAVALPVLTRPEPARPITGVKLTNPDQISQS